MKKLVIAVFVIAVLAAVALADTDFNNTTPAAPTGYILATIQRDLITHIISVAIPKPVVSCIGSTKPTCGTSVTLPACMGGGTGSTRNYRWDTLGATGVADVHEICQKDAADAYAWVAH
jgi:hypothetical protein